MRGRGCIGALPYIEEASCLPSGERVRNGYHGHPWIPTDSEFDSSREDDGYHVIGASGASRKQPSVRVKTEFGLHLDSSDAVLPRKVAVSL